MATRKEDEIKIPESVLNRANRSAIEASYGITGQERERYNIPKFPSFGGSTFLNPNPQFGFAASTMLDQEASPLPTRMEEQAVDYSRDAGTRMANRYTMPVSDLGGGDFRSGGFRTQLPTSRVGATAYSNPEMASYLEREKSEYIQPTQNVGQSGFGRQYTFGDREVQQIVSPYGIAQTSLTPQQVEQRAQARQEAEQKGTLPRTPEQQQALLAQIRQTGAGIRESIASRARDSFESRTPSRLYTTPSGAAIAAPTDMYGRPIADFQQRYAQREERLNDRGRSTMATLGATGFGAMQREQASMFPPPIRNQSLFGGMGYAATLGGPQPASSMVATGPMEDRTRRRIFGTV